MSIKILIYSLNFHPELTGIGKYSGEMALWLADRGHKVRVVTAQPYYPAWVVTKGYRNWWTKDEVEKEFTSTVERDLVIYRSPLWVPRKPGGVKRLFHLASFALSSFAVLIRQIFWRPDVVLVIEPALFCAPASLLVARMSGARAWLHVQDFEVDAAFELGLLRGKFMRSIVTSIERWIMRRFDVVSTISQRMYQRLLDKGVPSAKTVATVNWVDIEQYARPSLAGIAAYRKELDIPDDTIVALYSGNMGTKQGLELLAEVAKLVFEEEVMRAGTELNSYPPIVFVFCGNGLGRASLWKTCHGLKNVRFMDLQPAERLQDLLAMADIHLLPQRADAADLVMPSKLTGMLASARPVLATAHAGTELATVVQVCGLVVPPEDAVAFAHALINLAKNSKLRETLGAAGLLYAKENLDKKNVLAKLEANLCRVVSR